MARLSGSRACSVLNQLRVAARAENDIDALLRDSEFRFGAAIAQRYRRLLDEALAVIRTDPERAGVQAHVGLRPGLRLYHLRRARLRLPVAERIARPRHILVFRAGDGVVNLIRVLHDAMDMPRHLNDV